MELIAGEKHIIASNLDAQLHACFENVVRLLKTVRLQRYELRRLEKKKEIYGDRHRECFEAFAEQREHVKVLEDLVALKLLQNYTGSLERLNGASDAASDETSKRTLLLVQLREDLVAECIPPVAMKSKKSSISIPVGMASIGDHEDPAFEKLRNELEVYA